MLDRRCVWLLIAAGHLVAVVCGASCCLPDWNSGPSAQIVQWYATMSGAGSNYGFFAPVVGARHRARFMLINDKGSTWWDVFDHARSFEARLRLTGIVENAFMSGDADESPEWRKRLVESWAATMFTRHPSAESLAVVVEFYDTPTIVEYRAGTRPCWRTSYRGQVRRHSIPASVRSDQ
jgi:hypothetical protein